MNSSFAAPPKHCPPPAALLKKRKQLLDLVPIGLAAVFADFEALGVFDSFAFLFAVPLLKVSTEAVGFATAAAEPGLAEPVFAAGNVGGRRNLAHLLLAAEGS